MKEFLKSFFQQKGMWITASFLVSKVSSLLLTLCMARLLPVQDFGLVMYGLNYLGFFIPFVGLGASNATLRYGALSTDAKHKEKIMGYAFTYGLLLNFFINVVMLAIAFFLFGKTDRFFLITVFSIRFLGIFLLDQAKAEARANLNNKKFGQLDIYVNVLLLVSAVVLAYFYGLKGYVLSLCFAPFAVLFFHRFKFSSRFRDFNIMSRKDFWKFSVSMAITNQLSELIFLLDIFFIGIYLNSAAVAHYRVASIIPFNLLFIAAIFFQTSYPKLCEKHIDHAFQISFLVSFWKLILPVCLVILGLCFTLGGEILGLFGAEYREDSPVFHILLIAAVGVILMRTPFGYLLASKGKSGYNLMVSAISVVSLVVFIKPVMLQYGLVGVAWLSLANLSLIGVLLGFFYFYEVRRH